MQVVNPHRACARGLVVTLSVTLCVTFFDFGEGAVFSVETYISVIEVTI